MSKSIFLIECSAPHWVLVVKHLGTHGVIVSRWTAWRHLEPALSSVVDREVFHDTRDAKLALAPGGQKHAPVELDDAALAVWEAEAQTIYDMMNRFDHSRDQTMVERSQLFLQHLSLWSQQLNDRKPDLVVFSTPPHVVYDYVLLALCRARGVPTLMFEEATIFAPFCLAMSDYRSGSADLRRAVAGRPTPSPAALAVVDRLRGSYETGKPAREVVASATKAAALEAGQTAVERMVATIEQRDAEHDGRYDINERIVNRDSIHKEAGVPLQQSFQGDFANTRFARQLAREFEVTTALRASYTALVCDRDLVGQRPYVYFPLAGQPERTSNPQAGAFANQLLVASLICSALPSDWQCVVKEHPNQLHPQFAVNMCRDASYYETLARLPGLLLVPEDENPFSLIDGARAVATTGGTAALEAVARGVPAMLFGDAWYRDCPGVHRLRGATDTRAFLDDLAADRVSIGAGDFESFVESIRHGCFRGLADYPPENYPVDDVENAENLAATVLRWLEDA